MSNTMALPNNLKINSSSKENLEKKVYQNKINDTVNQNSDINKNVDISLKSSLEKFATAVENQYVKNKDDALYKASIEFAKVISLDSVYSKIFALSGYFLINEIKENKLVKKNN